MAKPDRQPKRRDGDRGHSRARDYREPMRDHVVLQLASSRRPSGPRQDNAKPQVVKQGVNGALRAANLRLLLEHVPVREALALVAEVPLERLEAMAQGALCPDETAFHIERTLKLPGKWLDGLNQEVPERTLELLKHPDKAELHDDDFDEDASAAPSVAVAATPARSAAALSAVTPPASDPTQAPTHDALAPHGQAVKVVAATPVEGSPEKAVVAAGRAKAAAAVEAPPAPGTPAAQAPVAAAATAAGEPRSSAKAARSEPGPKDTQPMSSPELRQQNLSVLLQGKGAKSALARLLGISQPYMSTIANGGKVLDQAFCRNVARTLSMPEDWFEAPRTTADIPAAALKQLVPLSRAAAASASATPTSDTAEAEAIPARTSGETAPEAASTPAGPSTSASAMADAAASDTAAKRTADKEAGQHHRIRPVPRRDNPQRSDPSRAATAPVRTPAAVPVQADLLTQVEPEVQSAAPAATPAPPVEVAAVTAVVPAPAPAMVPASETGHQVVQRTTDLAPVSAQPLVIDGGLAPITEALIKILVLKARQGALSEDKAFELLGAVRLL